MNSPRPSLFIIVPVLGILLSSVSLLLSTPSSASSLAARDSSGTLQPHAGETELVGERTRSFKKFRLPDGPQGERRYRVGGSLGPVHFQYDPASTTEAYKDIDLTVHSCRFWERLTKPALCGASQASPDYYMDKNGYQVRLWNTVLNEQFSPFTKGELEGVEFDSTQNTTPLLYVAEFRRSGHWLRLNPLALVWENAKGEQQLIAAVQNTNQAPVIDNQNSTVTWENAFGPGRDFRYNLSPDKFFKTVVLRSSDTLPAPTIDRTGLKLSVVLGLAWDPTTKLGNGFASSTVIDTLPSPVSFLPLHEGGVRGGGVQKIPDSTSPYPLLREGGETMRTSSVLLGENGPFDEFLPNPHQFPSLDQNGNQVWWLHQPRAWDSGTTTQEELPMTWELARHRNTVLATVSLPAEALLTPDLVWPLHVDAAIPEEQVGASADDGYGSGPTWPGKGPTVMFYSTYLYLGAGTNYFLGGGVRFTTIPIPVGATINTASLSLFCDQTTSVNIDITIYGDDHDNTVSFSNTMDTDSGGPAYRPLTTASSRWNIGTTPWSFGGWYTSPDISNVVQEVTSRSGWTLNGALGLLLFWTNQSYPGSNVSRTLAVYDSVPSWSPKFNATYTEAPANTAPNATSVSDSPDPATLGQTITFTGNWTESDAGDNVKMYVCKDAACTSCNNSSQAGCWCSSASYQVQPDTSDTCTITAGIANLGVRSYWLNVCDDQPACDSTPLAGGTFKSAFTSPLRLFKIGLSGRATSTVSKPPLPTAGIGLNQSLVGFWTMDGKDIAWGSTRITDRSGNGKSLTLAGLAAGASSMPGKIGQALRFNGSSSRISTTTAVDLSAGGTVSVWFKPTSLAGASSTLIANVSSSTNKYEIVLKGSTVTGIYTDSGIHLRSGTIANTNWHHAMFTWNGSTPALYLDGVAQ